MGIVFRQSVKTTIVVFLGAFLGAILILLTTKFVVDKQQFGFTRNLITQAALTAQILVFGFNSTMAVYVHNYADDIRKRNLIVSVALAVPMLLFLIALVPYFVFKDFIVHHYQPNDIPYIKQFYGLLPVSVFFFLAQVILEQFLATQRLVAFSAFIREVILRLLNIGVVVLYAAGIFSFHQLVYGIVFIYLVPVAVFSYLSFKEKKLRFAFDVNLLSKEEYTDIFKFTIFHFLLVLSILLNSSLDAICLPLYDKNGLASLAPYAIAGYLISIVQIPNKAMVQPTMNVIAQAYAREDMPHVRQLFTRSSINILIATCFIIAVLCSNIKNMTQVIGNHYDEIGVIFFILLIGKFVDIATGLNDVLLSITKHYKFNFYNAFALVFVLSILLRVLIPKYGIYGAAWSATIVTILSNVTKYIYILAKLKMQPLTANSFLVIVATVPAIAVGYYFPYLFTAFRHVYFYSFFDAIIRSVLVFVVYLSMLLWLKPSPDLVEYLGNIKKNKRLF
jgi:O-antigen/teichoic acid export membrane protein